MGAVVNMRPDLWCAVVMGVPFVDVVTTMLDPTIPLTVIEARPLQAPTHLFAEVCKCFFWSWACKNKAQPHACACKLPLRLSGGQIWPLGSPADIYLQHAVMH